MGCRRDGWMLMWIDVYLVGMNVYTNLFHMTCCGVYYSVNMCSEGDLPFSRCLQLMHIIAYTEVSLGRMGCPGAR
jgi:hypothetical protein